MARGELLTAAATLLTALRRDGCAVRADGNILTVRGDYTDAVREAIIACKAELLEILAAERSQGDPPAKPKRPASTLPRGPVVAGVAVMTPELFRWRALRDSAICRGEIFTEPAPKYYYPEFEDRDE
jgi:hypothetical protein